MLDFHFEGSLTEKQAYTNGRTEGCRCTYNFESVPCDIVLLEFGFYNSEVVHTDARVPELANHCFWVTMTLESATGLHIQHTSEEDTGCLANRDRPHTYS